MVHPATQRTALAAVTALGIKVDLGVVFPPRAGEIRGHGNWEGKDLAPNDVAKQLPWLAAGNARGGAVYMRPGPSCRIVHPGLVLLDDLDVGKLEKLVASGFEPCLVVQTSPGNLQAWVRLVTGPVDYQVVHAASRDLARRFGGDIRATSPVQPGRIPGFLNRKAKHRDAEGRYPFVKLISADPGRIAASGRELVDSLAPAELTQAAGAGAAAPETPRAAAHWVDVAAGEGHHIFDRLYQHAAQRIAREHALGKRPAQAASLSEVDFATTVSALCEGISPEQIAAWLASHRPEKASAYAASTVKAATEFLANGGAGPVQGYRRP